MSKTKDTKGMNQIMLKLLAVVEAMEGNLLVSTNTKWNNKH